MGVQGRRWRLPAEPQDVEARERFLGALGLEESAVTDVADADRRASVSAELYPAEREWLEQLCQAAGLASGGAPSRLVRVLIRAAIAHRDLLPIQAPLDVSDLPWLKSTDPQPMAHRLAPWLDALPREALDEFLGAVRSAVARRTE